MTPLIWLGIALLLILGETLVGDLSLLMLGGGALAAAGISLADVPLWAEVIMWAVVSVALLFTVRPILRKKMMAEISHQQFTAGPKELMGKVAVVVEEVTSVSGLVKVSGELWSARTLVRGTTIPVDSEVVVVNIDGNTAIVDSSI